MSRTLRGKVAAEATAIAEHPDGTVTVDWDGGSVTADTAILTTGRAPDTDPYPHPPVGSPAGSSLSRTSRRRPSMES